MPTLVQNTKSKKWGVKLEKSGAQYSSIHLLFFAFRAHFHVFCDKRIAGLKVALFFYGINKTQNLHEMRKVYSECFVFHGVFCEKHSRNAKNV